VRVHVRVAATERIQVLFEVRSSAAPARRARETFTVRKVSYGVGGGAHLPSALAAAGKVEVVAGRRAARGCTTCGTAPDAPRA
jgi:hypothetical protein